MPSSNSVRTSFRKEILQLLLVTGLYYAAARLGLLLALGYRNVSAVWPPSGLAVAILVLYGRRALPAVFLGAYLANYSTGLPILTSVAIAAGNSAEALAAFHLLSLGGKSVPTLVRTTEVLRLIISAAVSATIAASIGVASLCAGGFVKWSAFAPASWTWWVGDVMGIMIVTPLLLTWLPGIRKITYTKKVNGILVLEAAVIFGGLLLVTDLVFARGSAYPYAVFPFLICAAVRYGPIGASLAVFAASGLSIIATVEGPNPLFKGTDEGGLIQLQIWMAVVAASSMLLAAAVAERRRAEEEVSALNERLALAVTETHHRVKNNLQVIGAMIDLLIMEERDTLSIDEVKRLSMHVHTLALVHELLTDDHYVNDHTKLVSARTILERLLPLIENLCSGRTVNFTVDDAALTARQGTSLAIVVNEIVQNSLKHGKGDINVSYRVQNGVSVLAICDQGSGFPNEFRPNPARTSGLSLVEHLVRTDLSGRVTYRNQLGGGGCVEVEAPLVEFPPAPQRP